MEGIDAVESTRVNETHEEVPDVSTMLCLKEQRILPMENCPFENLFANIVIQGYPGNSQKQTERLPMV